MIVLIVVINYFVSSNIGMLMGFELKKTKQLMSQLRNKAFDLKQYKINLSSTKHYPFNRPVGASIGPVLGRCWQHQPITGPVRACLQGN